MRRKVHASSGRCADKILEETEGLISFIYAPMETRVKEIMRRYETDEKKLNT